MTSLCLAPLIMVGYLQTIQTEWHTSYDISGPMAEIQTCKEGFGARVAWSGQMVQIGPQFGYTWPINEMWSITGQFHGGLGYSNTIHPESGIRQITLFNGGVAFMIHYHKYSVKIGYDHQSNGKGIDPTNHGIDMLTTGVGYGF